MALISCQSTNLNVNAPPEAVSSTAASGEERSIRNWIACNGNQDDSAGFARALDAAKNKAFRLVIDCTVRLQIGKDIARTQFIESGTTIIFRGNGKITVDNVLLPAFVIANSSEIDLLGWNLEYVGGVPANWDVGGFDNNGKSIPMKGYAQPAFAFNNERITPWLIQHREIKFDSSAGNVGSRWYGPTNSSAVFYIVGDVFNVKVSGMRVSVPKDANVSQYVPMVFSIQPNWKSNQTITATTPLTGQYLAVPHDLSFVDVDFDGTYMGFQGGGQNLTFEHIRSHRYGDLQDRQGLYSGGIGKWFAPPHLFYLNYGYDGDPTLFNRNITIKDVVDDGIRAGTARDKAEDKPLSGYALSLKIGCHDCSVNNYKSSRPDGFLDLLPSDGITISNVQASYDSSFINSVYPGWRFPIGPYKRVVFENIELSDNAKVTTQAPIGNTNVTGAADDSFVFKNVRVNLNEWGGKGSYFPDLAGAANDVSIDYNVKSQAHRIRFFQKGNQKGSMQTPAQ